MTSVNDQRRGPIPARLETVLARTEPPAKVHAASEIRETGTTVVTRDGIVLATDLYLPPAETSPTIVVRTPYGRAKGRDSFLALARAGYAVVAQDVRGTGESEPDYWDFGIFEAEDGLDVVDWILRQSWYDGFIGSAGASYGALTQWALARHPRMTAFSPEVGALGALRMPGIRLHMMVNAYSRSVGRGDEKVPVDVSDLEGMILEETFATGYFDGRLAPLLPEPVLDRYPRLGLLTSTESRRQLWEIYTALDPAGRAELLQLATGHSAITYTDTLDVSAYFPDGTSMSALIFPVVDVADLYRSIQAPPLVVTGWYDWGLAATLTSWNLLQRHAPAHVRANARLIISPSAHNKPGYHEGSPERPPLEHVYRATEDIGLLVHWSEALRDDAVAERFPTVTYYLLGANEWRAADAWPPPAAEPLELYLARDGGLSVNAPAGPADPDRYRYDPTDPPPTLGGSIISSVLTPGSVDVAPVQARPDVLSYSTEPLERDLDVVGAVAFTLYAGSDAPDTDFSVRLSDVFPDGRAIQLQSGMVRCRYRDPERDPEPLDPDAVYRFDVDLAGVANRFAAGHRIRVDICSADFPKFERNTNRGGADGPPLVAEQRIYRDADHASVLRISTLK